MKFIKFLICCILVIIVFARCHKNVQPNPAPPSSGISLGALQQTGSNCAISGVYGIYVKDSLLSNSNYLEVRVNIQNPGTYTIYTDTVNGMNFKAAGKFLNAGTDSVRLSGTGKPDSAGFNNFMVHYDTSLCNFSLKVNLPPLADSGLAYTSDLNGYIYAFNSLSGRLVWTFSTGNQIVASPTLNNGSLYLGTEGGNMLCLDELTGALKWHVYTGSNSEINHIDKAAAVEGGMLYFTCNDNNLYAADTVPQIVNGVPYINFRWKYSRGEVGNGGGQVPAANNTTAFVGDDGPYFYAINAATGTLKWIDTIPDQVWAAPVLANGNIYLISTQGIFYALNQDNGSVIWESNYYNRGHTGGGACTSSPTLYNGVLFGAPNEGNGSVVEAVYAATGKVKWIFSAPTNGYSGHSSPTYGNGMVYIASEDGKLYAIDAETGLQKWNYDTEVEGLYASPVYANGFVYYCIRRFGIYCLDAATGKFVWGAPVQGLGVAPAVRDINGIEHNSGESGNHS